MCCALPSDPQSQWLRQLSSRGRCHSRASECLSGTVAGMLDDDKYKLTAGPGDQTEAPGSRLQNPCFPETGTPVPGSNFQLLAHSEATVPSSETAQCLQCLSLTFPRYDMLLVLAHRSVPSAQQNHA